MDYSVPVTQARAEFAELINRAAYAQERTVITRHGRPIAALVSAADLERLAALDRLQPPTIVRLGGGPIGGPGTSAPTGPDSFGLAAHHPGAGDRDRPEPGRPGIADSGR
jgi:prevent-host-death family protein